MKITAKKKLLGVEYHRVEELEKANPRIDKCFHRPEVQETQNHIASQEIQGTSNKWGFTFSEEQLNQEINKSKDKPKIEMYNH